MISDEIRQKLQNIISGNVLQGQETHCSAIRNLLIRSFGTNSTAKREFESRSIVKEKQAILLKDYAQRTGLWITSLPADIQYLTKGGESQVYLAADFKHVFKVNDGIYYATWTEYFTSLAIHNLLFFDTPYELIGFTVNDHQALCAVVAQSFVKGGQAALADIQDYLTFNGFTHTKRQDYFNEEFRILLEDMHDENVIARDDVLFFIDTVFYIMDDPNKEAIPE